MEPALLLLLGVANIIGELNNYGIDPVKYPHLKDIRVRRDAETDPSDIDIQTPEITEVNNNVDKEIHAFSSEPENSDSIIDQDYENNDNFYKNPSGLNDKINANIERISTRSKRYSGQNYDTVYTKKFDDTIVSNGNNGPGLTEVQTTLNYIPAERSISTVRESYPGGDVIVTSNHPVNNYDTNSYNQNSHYKPYNYNQNVAPNGYYNNYNQNGARFTTYKPYNYNQNVAANGYYNNYNQNAARFTTYKPYNYNENVPTLNNYYHNVAPTQSFNTRQPMKYQSSTNNYNHRSQDMQTVRSERQIAKEVYTDLKEAKQNIEATDRELRLENTVYNNNGTLTEANPHFYNPFNNTNGFTIYGYTPFQGNDKKRNNGTTGYNGIAIGYNGIATGYNGTATGYNGIVNNGVNKRNKNATVLQAVVIGNIGCPQFMKRISIMGMKICTPEDDYDQLF